MGGDDSSGHESAEGKDDIGNVFAHDKFSKKENKSQLLLQL